MHRLGSCIVSRRGLIGLAVGVSALVVSACAADPSTGAFIETPYGQVPDVRGQDAQQAWETLVEKGYLPRFFQSEDEGAEGTVVSLEIEELSVDISPYPADASGIVHEELSNAQWIAVAKVGLKGMSQIPPTLQVGFSEADARSALAEAGFVNVTAEHIGNVDSAANRVIETNPAPAAWALLDQEVTLTVTSDITMPNIIGADPVTATGTLEVSGLRADPAIHEYGGVGPVVVETSVEAGQTVRAGTVIEITYSEKL